jgi:hypothetical protein
MNQVDILVSITEISQIPKRNFPDKFTFHTTVKADGNWFRLALQWSSPWERTTPPGFAGSWIWKRPAMFLRGSEGNWRSPSGNLRPLGIRM